jgi:hypothetical protein
MTRVTLFEALAKAKELGLLDDDEAAGGDEGGSK